MPGPRTRFAPSPSGFLHLGHARTALFNFAYARRFGGSFILRIEDTDRARSTAEFETALQGTLRWLGLDWDEGPVRQSDRRASHEAAIERLLAKGHAYRCVCTREELEQRQRASGDPRRVYDGRCRNRELGPDCGPHTIRLRVDPEAKLGWDDLVFGPSGQKASEIGDVILRRTDGSPLYHLAVVVDDLDMGITHVIRGADHHSNTPLQIAIYRALDSRLPVFAHVPLIVAEGGRKLSKRREAVSVEQFREDGYLSEAMCNWIVRLGWSHGDEEIFSLDAITRLFDLTAVGRNPAQADPAKLLALNQHYLKKIPMDALVKAVMPWLERVAGRAVEVTPELSKLLDLLRERSKTLADMAEHARPFLVDELVYDEQAIAKHLREPALPVLRTLAGKLAEVRSWDEATLESVFETTRSELGDVSMGKIAQPVRAAVTGRTFSPGIFETLAVLGRERSLARLGAAIALVEESAKRA